MHACGHARTFEEDLHELAEARGVIVAEGLGVAKGLEDGVGLEDVLRDRGLGALSSHEGEVVETVLGRLRLARTRLAAARACKMQERACKRMQDSSKSKQRAKVKRQQETKRIRVGVPARYGCA